MNHLIIYANHNDGSFNHAVLENLKNTLLSLNHEVRVRDLYAMKFDPVLTTNDFKLLHSGQLPSAISEEQQHITWADVITIVHPVWWTGFPAILKGYIDRVFLYGFAYKMGPNGAEGLLHGKKVLIFSSTGQPKEAYENGMYHAMNMTTNTGIFEFCGMTVLDHIFFPSVISITDHQRSQYIQDAVAMVKRLFAKGDN